MEKIIISTSRLVKKNGLDSLIRAVALSINDDISCRLIIIGEGPERDYLQSLINNLDLNEKVALIGYLDQAPMINYLKKADIFVRPSRSEGLGNSFLEAMAMGIPVIGTPVGGIIDFLQDGETGLYCAVDDPSTIAAAIKKLLTDKALREKIVTNAYQLVRDHYRWELIAKQYRGVFNRLV